MVYGIVVCLWRNVNMGCRYCGKEFEKLIDGYEHYGEYCSVFCLGRAFGLGVNG